MWLLWHRNECLLYFLCGRLEIKAAVTAVAIQGVLFFRFSYHWCAIYNHTANCAWLTKNVINVAYRIGRWCPEAAIGYACPLTCGTCRNGCSDDPSWTFTLINEGTAKNCSWITENYLKVEIRRTSYCGDEEIVGKCPKSCGVCP